MVKLEKIAAVTLIESIVAMVIITLVFGIALMILSAVTGKNNPQLRLKAYTQAQRALDRCRCVGDLQSVDWQEEGLRIESKVIDYPEHPGIKQVEIQIFNNSNRLLINRRILLLSQE